MAGDDHTAIELGNQIVGLDDRRLNGSAERART